MNLTVEKVTAMWSLEILDNQYKSLQENLETLDKIVVATLKWQKRVFTCDVLLFEEILVEKELLRLHPFIKIWYFILILSPLKYFQHQSEDQTSFLWFYSIHIVMLVMGSFEILIERALIRDKMLKKYLESFQIS